MKIEVRKLATALAVAGPLALTATVQSSAAPINGTSIQSAVPAVTTDVRYYPYASYWYGYPRYYGYPSHWAYSPYWRYRWYHAYNWW